MARWSSAILAATLALATIPAWASPGLRAAQPQDTPTGGVGPVIGILSLPNYSSHAGRSYFAASYVKWLESAGARVVPVPYTMAEGELKALLGKLNGVLFTGGGTDFAYDNHTLTPFAATAQLIVDEVKTAAAQGETFPLWGTCLGFELINFLLSGPTFVPPVLVTGFDSENLPLPLNFTSQAASSRLFSWVRTWYGDTVYATLASQYVTMNNHQSGVPPAAFLANVELKSTLSMLSTNVDRNGKPFVSMVEGTNLPVYATQWHPEKNMFEWDQLENIPHTTAAVVAAMAPAQFFVNEARKNNRTFGSLQELQDALIYNYPVVYTGKADPSFQQSYFFE